MKHSQLDHRICDCEDLVDNTETYREYIIASEEHFEMPRASVDDLSDEELAGHIEFLDYLWEK